MQSKTKPVLAKAIETTPQSLIVILESGPVSIPWAKRGQTHFLLLPVETPAFVRQSPDAPTPGCVGQGQWKETPLFDKVDHPWHDPSSPLPDELHHSVGGHEPRICTKLVA